MDVIDQLRAFVATAQAGSFTVAADQLGISNRLTSKYVAELEARLGVRLLQRTTRKVGLTPAGEDLVARAPALLDDLDTLLGEVTESSLGFSGIIRISAPVTFGEIYLTSMLARFAEQNPGLTFDLRFTDRFADLAGEGIDLAFRVGQSEMRSIKARRLGEFQSMLVASPGYVAAHGAPYKPEDLEAHSCIVDTNRRNARRWTFHQGESEIVANVKGRFNVNSARAAIDLAKAGHGIAYAPRFVLSDALTAGDLVPVMTNYQAETGPVSAVYLEGRSLPRKIRALIDFAVEDIRATDIL